MQEGSSYLAIPGIKIVKSHHIAYVLNCESFFLFYFFTKLQECTHFYLIYLFSQATVTTTPIIRVSLPPASASATTNIKPNPTPGTAVQKPPTATGTAIFTPSCTTGTTIIKPASVIGTAVRKPSSTMGPVIKASQMTPNSSTSGSFNQRTNSVTATTIINTTAVKVLLTLATSIIDPNNKTNKKKQKNDSYSYFRARC